MEESNKLKQKHSIEKRNLEKVLKTQNKETQGQKMNELSSTQKQEFKKLEENLQKKEQNMNGKLNELQKKHVEELSQFRTDVSNQNKDIHAEICEEKTYKEEFDKLQKKYDEEMEKLKETFKDEEKQKEEIEQLKKKFEQEINNLKEKVLYTEKKLFNNVTFISDYSNFLN